MLTDDVQLLSEQDENVKQRHPKKPVLQIARPILHEAHLREIVKRSASEKRQINEVKRQRFKAKLMNPQTIKKKLKSSFFNLFPFISTLRHYHTREYLPKDIVSGLSVGMMVIPQAIAYAGLAHMKPQNGFYSSFFGMLLYFFLGSSKHVNMSNSGVISLLVGNVIMNKAWKAVCENPDPTDNRTTTGTTEDYGYSRSQFFDDQFPLTTSPGGGSAEGCIDPELAWVYGVTLTFMTGLFQLAFGVLRLGVLSIFLSDPLVNALTCGAAIHILESQIAPMLGMTKLKRTSGTGQLLLNIEALFENIRDVNGATILLAVFCCLILILGRKLNTKLLKCFPVPIPFDILVLLIALIISVSANLEESFSVKVVGPIQRGFSEPTLPQWNLMKGMLMDTLTVSILSYSMGVSVAKAYAVKHGYEVDANQELIAGGSINMVISLFNGFVATVSLACSSLNDCLGGKSQVHSLVAAFVVFLGIVGIGPIFHYVPQCALSAIILVNLFGTVLQVKNIITLWELNKFDWVIWFVTLTAVLLLNVDIGLGVGLIFSLATVIYRTHSAGSFVLGRLPGTDVYRNIDRNPSAQEIHGLKIFKFEGNLYFGSAENFRRSLYYKTKLYPKKLMAAKLKAKAREIMEEGNGRQPSPSQVIHSNPALEMDEMRADEEQMNRRTLSNTSCVSTRQRGMSIITHEMKRIRADDAIIEQENQRDVFTLQTPRQDEEFDLNTAGQVPESTVTRTVNSTNDVLPVQYIILDMSACAFIDSVGIRVLTQIIHDYDKVEIHLLLACVAGYVRRMLTNAGFHEKVPQCHAFVTVHDAVLAALHGIMEDYVEAEYTGPTVTTTTSTQDMTDNQTTSETLQINFTTSYSSEDLATPAVEKPADERKASSSKLETVHENKEQVVSQLAAFSSSGSLLNNTFLSSLEKDHLMETIQHLSHHNKLLRRMLDRVEGMEIPIIRHREQASQTEISYSSDTPHFYQSYAEEPKERSKSRLGSLLNDVFHKQKSTESSERDNGWHERSAPHHKPHFHGEQHAFAQSRLSNNIDVHSLPT